jgi:hypothetical protein
MDTYVRKGRPRHTCESLGLNPAAGYAGNLDEVLPEGKRTLQGALDLPVPTSRAELMVLCKIQIPPDAAGPGAAYLKRVHEKWGRSTTVERKAARHRSPRRAYAPKSLIRHTLREIKRTMEEVQVSADIAHQEAASITRLFDLCRQAIEGQLAAHLEGKTWKGEPISARAARECFRLVAQSVSGLKLPSDQRRSATESTMNEIARAIEETKDALTPIAPPPPSDPETTH